LRPVFRFSGGQPPPHYLSRVTRTRASTPSTCISYPEFVRKMITDGMNL